MFRTVHHVHESAVQNESGKFQSVGLHNWLDYYFVPKTDTSFHTQHKHLPLLQKVTQQRFFCGIFFDFCPMIKMTRRVNPSAVLCNTHLYSALGSGSDQTTLNHLIWQIHSMDERKYFHLFFMNESTLNPQNDTEFPHTKACSCFADAPSKPFQASFTFVPQKAWHKIWIKT